MQVQTSKYAKPQRDLELELANRERNLAVIEETIQRDPTSGAKLFEVRDMLVKRVTDLRFQLAIHQRKVEVPTLN
jgi:hypothetical protein